MPKYSLIKRFHAALIAAQLADSKYDMLASYGVESTKDLTDEQLLELIDKVNGHKPGPPEAPKPVRKLRHQVLNLLTDLEVMKYPNDWDSVNAFLEQPRILGKRLNQTTDIAELKSLVAKLRSIKRKRDTKLDEERYLTTNN